MPASDIHSNSKSINLHNIHNQSHVMVLKRIYLFLCLSGISLLSSAQSAMLAKSDSILKEFEDRFAVLDALIFTPAPSGKEYTENIFIDATRKYADTLTADSLYDEALRKSVEAQAKYIKSPTGLQITGQTYYRLD